MDNETSHYIRRINQYNYDLEQRCGELYHRLHEISPTDAEDLTPITDYPTRYHHINKIINTVGNWYGKHILTTEATEEYAVEALNEIFDHLMPVHAYWINVKNERQKRAAITEKRKNTIAERNLAENA